VKWVKKLRRRKGKERKKEEEHLHSFILIPI